VELMNRWRQIIDKSIPRNDIMEIAWENIPAAWEQEMAALRVCLLFLFCSVVMSRM
jgi:FKBP12-rapamycin complex-associated protein